jgi:ATP-dependent protease HslVU (ClpYQ) peptidase subunit
MTTIVWDGRILAADRKRVVLGTPTPARKVFRVNRSNGDRYLVGCAGDLSDCVAFLRWMKSNGEAVKPSPTSFQALVIDAKRRIWWIDEKLVYIRLTEKRWAVGSGADYALGAMVAGKSAIEAVRIASRLDNSSGMGMNAVWFT